MRKYLDANIIANTKDMPREEWLNKRRVGIGGSDASSILGFNPYRSSMAVYLDKIRYAHFANDKSVAQNCDAQVLGGLKDEPVAQIVEPRINETHSEETSYKMELGNKLKSFVASEFMLKSGKKVRNINGILQNDKYPFAIANIDRGVVGEKAFLECKVTNSFNKKEWSATVPIHYQIQMNHYMAVTGATHCYVAVLIGNEELVIHKLDRDKDLIEEI
ncbi:MAG: YqaJ viral recombinase family protein, partial [Romboutsia sp.]|nr:YqaJ viral recombinase family protein [Romboutsia sp.]